MSFLLQRGSRASRCAALAATALVALPAALASGETPSAARQQSYTTVPGPTRSDARFVVTYEGSGSYKTRFHATPPNDGGKPDTNDAWDTSTQAWKLRFRRAAVIPACGQPSDGSSDPCTDLTGLSGASGPTDMWGHVNHRHVDGLYRQLDRTVKCSLRKRPSPRRLLDASLRLRYVPESQSIAVSASDPIATAVALFPTQCPQQGDSIDRILDFYAMPGFSFAQGYGPELWFASREVSIPVAAFHKSSKIRVRLGLTPDGTPPKHCAVHDPSFERCKTGGSWSGVLTFKAQKGAAKAVAAAARAAKVRVPRSGAYNGTARGKPITIYTSGKSIQIVAFDFACHNVSGVKGRTSLNAIKLTKTSKGYKFGIRAYASITYSDDHPDENGKVAISGRFSRTGKSAKGVLRVKSSRCGDTGSVKWSVSR
jgi:hypothetical protein